MYHKKRKEVNFLLELQLFARFSFIRRQLEISMEKVWRNVWKRFLENVGEKPSFSGASLVLGEEFGAEIRSPIFSVEIVGGKAQSTGGWFCVGGCSYSHRHDVA